MKRTTLFATLGAGFCVLATLSCSGGGGGGTGAPSATATSSVSSGVITGFGSVEAEREGVTRLRTPRSWSMDSQDHRTISRWAWL